MDRIGESPEAKSLEGFKLLVYLTKALGIVLIILISVWIGHYRGGLAWRSNPGLEFNWHPLLMTIGLVVLYANALLIYRVQRNMRKKRLKLMHAGIMLFIVILTVVALVAVFDSHNLQNIPNMYSLHSWIGMTSVVLFCCQWVAGCVSFLYPGLHLPLRGSYMPIHVYFGVAGFIGVIASCLLGLNEKLFFLKNAAMLPPEGVLINVTGLVLITFAGLTVYLVTQERYKRQPRSEDESLITDGAQ